MRKQLHVGPFLRFSNGPGDEAKLVPSLHPFSIFEIVTEPTVTCYLVCSLTVQY